MTAPVPARPEQDEAREALDDLRGVADMLAGEYGYKDTVHRILASVRVLTAALPAPVPADEAARALEAVTALCDRWEREAEKRGHEDRLYTHGVVFLLREALAAAAPEPSPSPDGDLRQRIEALSQELMSSASYWTDEVAAIDLTRRLAHLVADDCGHESESGDEGPVADLPGGFATLVRWRCDGCGRIRYDDDALARLRAALSASSTAPEAPSPDGAEGFAEVERLCEVMHNAYEYAAGQIGWETQEVSRVPWAEVPVANQVTMRYAVRALLAALAAAPDVSDTRTADEETGK